MISGQQLHWYAVRVKSNREWVTAEALKGKDFEVFLPTYQQHGSGRNTARAITVPLFAGYLFCRFDVGNRLPILMVPGVVHIVGYGSTPEPVDEDEIERVSAVTQSHLQVTPYPYPPVGESVCLSAGPLRGVAGVVLAHQDENKLVVSVTLLQRAIAVDVERDWVAPACLQLSSGA
jgi:transcription antitermination factor NusG